jgi:hypothetical protein
VKRKRLLTVVGSFCLIIVLVALFLPGCAEEEAPVTPTPAEFEVISLDIEPSEVVARETVTITAVVGNTGGSEGTYVAVLAVDGITVETKEVAITSGSSKVVTFSLVKDAAGTYEIGMGGLSSSLVVKEKLVITEFELKYDDGEARDFISAYPPILTGYLVDFTPPATPFTIKKVQICGVLLYGSGCEGKNFEVEIWDKDYKVLHSATYPVTKFVVEVATWVEVEIPDIEVTDKFYVHVYTGTGIGEGIHMGADDSIVNEHSETTIRTAEGTDHVLVDWPYTPTLWFGDKSKVNWMIRVVGMGMMPPKPAEFTASNLTITPAIAETGQIVTVTADIGNTGEIEGSYAAVLKIDGVQVETKEVTVGSGISQTVSFTFAKDAVGIYNIEVGSLSRLVIVVEGENILAQLSATFPELCQELLKLPDLKEIDDKDNEAIEDIAYLALNAEYRLVFELILNEGIEDQREYCTPLEALLWIAYDREFDGFNPLNNYSLTNLINYAWGNTTTSNNFTSGRWLNFTEVTDRLNSPELIAIYMQNNFSYSYTKGEAEGVKSAEQIFEDKKGACYDHALFAAYCLKKNGYDNAWGAKVTFDRIVQGYYTGHIGCIYQDPKDSLYYCMDFGTKGYTVYGPYSSIEEAAQRNCEVGSMGGAGLASYSLHDIDLETGKYTTTWY